MNTSQLMWLNNVPFQDVVSRAQTLANRTDTVVTIVDAVSGKRMKAIAPSKPRT